VAVTENAPRKVRPKHVSAVKFVNDVTYTTVIIPIVCLARYLAELVNQNELARLSPCQKQIADHQKISVAFTKIVYVQDFSDHQQFISDRQQFISDRQHFFIDHHPHENRAGLCVTLWRK
jgi:hypothetical protein